MLRLFIIYFDKVIVYCSKDLEYTQPCHDFLTQHCLCWWESHHAFECDWNNFVYRNESPLCWAFPYQIILGISFTGILLVCCCCSCCCCRRNKHKQTHVRLATISSTSNGMTSAPAYHRLEQSETWASTFMWIFFKIFPIRLKCFWFFLLSIIFETLRTRPRAEA